MSKVCDVCGKRPQVGNNVAHSNKKTKRVFKPNLQKVRVKTESGGSKHVNVCTRCIRSGRIEKPSPRVREVEQTTP